MSGRRRKLFFTSAIAMIAITTLHSVAANAGYVRRPWVNSHHHLVRSPYPTYRAYGVNTAYGNFRAYSAYDASTPPITRALPRPASDCYLPSDGCPNEYSVQN
jgi:hypothetical protein